MGQEILVAMQVQCGRFSAFRILCLPAIVKRLNIAALRVSSDIDQRILVTTTIRKFAYISYSVPEFGDTTSFV